MVRTYGPIGFLKTLLLGEVLTEKFAREGIDAEYLNFEIEDILQLREVILSTSTCTDSTSPSPTRRR